MRIRIPGVRVRWDTPWALHARRATKWVEEGLRAPADGGPHAVRIEAHQPRPTRSRARIRDTRLRDAASKAPIAQPEHTALCSSFSTVSFRLGTVPTSGHRFATSFEPPISSDTRGPSSEV